MRHKRSTLVHILGNAVISAIGFALFLTFAPTASAQTTVYAITKVGVFGTLNLGSGAFTQLGNPGGTPAGMGGLGTNLFAAFQGSNVLYLVNPANGSLSTVGNGSITYDDFGSTTAALYALDTSLNLDSINPANGSATLIGAIGVGPCSGSSSMSADGPGLYFSCDQGSGSILYSLNTMTGAATAIGNTGLTQIDSMVFANGLLYAAPHNGTLYTLNTQTGAATFVANTGQILYGMGLPASTFSVLHNFSSGNNGSNPFAGLAINASDNILYGSTGAGGTGTCSYSGLTGCGIIFKLNKRNSAWVFDPVYSFQGGSTDGEFPVRPVTIGSNGTLYGATLGGGEGTCSYDGDSGCGIVFNAGPPPTPPLTPLQKFNESVLYHFTGEGDGGVAFTTVVFDSSGNMYGTTYNGGSTACTGGCGTVFKLTPSGGGHYTESVIYPFGGVGASDGEYPVDGLILDTAGNLYGTTTAGGSPSACAGEGCGIVFELSPSGSGWTEKVLYRFQGPSDGENPNSGVVMDVAENLYGNTWQGGPGGGGTVWELSPSGGGNYTFNLLYSVPVSGYAVGRLARDSNGNLYEALQNGGASNDGQIFELTPSNGSWIFTDLHDFTNGTDGGEPIGGVVLDSSGNIYGTALFGGANTCGNGAYGCGNVWEIAPN